MENTNEDTQEVTQSQGNEEIRDPKAVLEALERAKTDAKKHRETLEAKEAEVAELNERIAALEGDEGIAAWKDRVIGLHAKAELTKAGVKDVDRIYGLMGSEGLSLDDEGNLQGFAEALSGLKGRLPELFDDKRRVAREADAFTSTDGPTEDPFRAGVKKAMHAK